MIKMSIDVLLIDTEEANVKPLAIILEKEFGYSVCITKTENGARELMRQKKFDVVVMEPIVDQHTTLLELIHDIKAIGIPVILASGTEEERLRNRYGMARGKDFDAYLGIPYTAEELHAVFTSIIKK